MTPDIGLREEYSYYVEERARLLDQNLEGKFALIKDQVLVGTFDTEDSAYREGLRRFGNVPFLIVQISKTEVVSWIPCLDLGLIHADL